MDFKTLFSDFECDSVDKMTSVFQRIKPIIIDSLTDFLPLNRKGPAGRPIKTDFNHFTDAMYFMVELCSKFNYVKQYGIPTTTFYGYLKILSENKYIIN